MEVAKARQ